MDEFYKGYEPNYYFELKDKNTNKIFMESESCPVFINNKDEDYYSTVLKIKDGDVVRIDKKHIAIDTIIALTDKFNLEFHQITKDTFDIKFKNKEMLVCNSKQLLGDI